MIALKLLLNLAGVLLLAAAVAIPLYGVWLRIRIARRQAGGAMCRTVSWSVDAECLALAILR